MATNEILPFATTNTGTNLLTQSEYATGTQRPVGHVPGVAESKLENKALRQATLIAAGVAQFISQYQNNNVTDSLTVQQVADYLLASVKFQTPTGIIVMWSGVISAIPAGWFLCDGANGTPNLRDRFIVGAGSSYAVNAIGGNKDASIISHQHTFSGSTLGAGSHSHSINDPGHNHTVTTNAGRFQPNEGGDAGGGLQGLITSTTNTKATGISINAVGDHAHSVSVSGTTGALGGSTAHSHSLNLAVQYVDVIICTKS
jgi:hypothetical protein